MSIAPFLPLCLVSINDYPVDDGVTCGSGHFIVADSFSHLVSVVIPDDRDDFIARGNVSIHPSMQFQAVDASTLRAIAVFLCTLYSVPVHSIFPDTLRAEAENFRADDR